MLFVHAVLLDADWNTAFREIVDRSVPDELLLPDEDFVRSVNGPGRTDRGLSPSDNFSQQDAPQGSTSAYEQSFDMRRVDAQINDFNLDAANPFCVPL